MPARETRGSLLTIGTRAAALVRQPKGSRRWSARIPALAAGKSAEITVPLPSGGQVGLPLVVVLDPSGEVVESDEKNNRVDVR